MKKLLAVVVLLVCFTTAWGQNATKSIEDRFIAYNQLITEGKFEQSMDYLHPKMFDLVPREQLVAIMESLLKNPDMQMKFGATTIRKINEIEKIDNGYYAIINYDSAFSMRLSYIEDLDGEDKKSAIEMMEQGFKEQFTTSSYDEKTGFFNILSNKNAVAYSVDQKNWTYITLDSEKQKEMLAAFIPKSVLAKM